MENFKNILLKRYEHSLSTIQELYMKAEREKNYLAIYDVEHLFETSVRNNIQKLLLDVYNSNYKKDCFDFKQYVTEKIIRASGEINSPKDALVAQLEANELKYTLHLIEGHLNEVN